MTCTVLNALGSGGPVRYGLWRACLWARGGESRAAASTDVALVLPTG